ncbi:MAG: transposase family protein, partial [Anaerophaga sp.]|nr:transposase family protein [Anaerophaga sp.]
MSQDLITLPDSRQRKQYHTQELWLAGITMFMFKKGSRNAYNNERKDPLFRNNYNKLFGLSLPHMDSVDDFFRELPEQKLEKVKVNMGSHLIRKKVLEAWKFRDYYIVTIDRTGISTFDHKHCEMSEVAIIKSELTNLTSGRFQIRLE